MRPGIDYIGVSIGIAIMNNEGKFLLSKRSQNCRNEKGLWEFPGGQVHFGEKLVDAVKREAFEELGVEVEILQLLGCFNHILSEEKQHWVPTTFVCRVVSGIPKIMEPKKCDGLKLAKLEEINYGEISVVTKLDVKKLKEFKTAGK